MSLTQRFSRAGIIAIVVAALYSSSAGAQVARVFLSATGDDLNVCTDTSTPCRSLQAAVTQCPVNGEVIVLTSGGFGTATITKSLTINAPAGVVAFNARTIIVNIAPTDKVVIRGLSMNGTIFMDPNGINFISGGTLIVENCLLTGFGNGIEQSSAGSRLVVNNSEFRANTQNGILSHPSVSGTQTCVTVENCRFEDNGQAGVGVFDWVRAMVRHSVATGNGRGYQIVGSEGPASSSTSMLIDDCVSSYNKEFGIAVLGQNQAAAPQARVTRSSIFGNAIGLTKIGLGTIVSYGTNQVWNNNTDGAFTSAAPTM